jgi:hypothetical protein
MSTTIPYEQQLSHDAGWAMSEASQYFEGGGAVQRTLQRITKRLDEIGVAYAIVGGMALFHHGVRRFTEDVDILVDAGGLALIHQRLEGLGYVTPFAGSKNLRDTDSGVKIEFLVAGQFPGDGKPKAVAFPDPRDVATEVNGVRYLKLETLVELKLASGLSNPDRMKDIADVYELIKQLQLRDEFAERLNPWVQAKFRELCRTAQQYGQP